MRVPTCRGDRWHTKNQERGSHLHARRSCYPKLPLCRGAFASSDINHPWPFERLGRAPCARWAGQASRALHARARWSRRAHRARLPLPRRRLRFAQRYPPYRCAGTRRWRRRARQAHCARARRVPRPCGYWTAPRLRRGKPGARATALPRWRALPCSCCGAEGAWDRGSRVMLNGPRGPRAMLPAT